ncbi:unnamed protein product [Darwinula stevensoni]|uniref:Uncharacterized protein n=1 Tax=Darwinula stevensoni TaxID=69355 RepID=A0A7R9FQ33_9CRUS|nr:unnamed protein product [Darwinula stevensoni]CAG0898995.1 unnamed protein product [Darwinula stevensoni]
MVEANTERVANGTKGGQVEYPIRTSDFGRKVPWLLPEVSRILAGDLDPGVSRYLEGTIVTLPYPELTPGQPTIVKGQLSNHKIPDTWKQADVSLKTLHPNPGFITSVMMNFLLKVRILVVSHRFTGVIRSLHAIAGLQTLDEFSKRHALIWSLSKTENLPERNSVCPNV